MPRSTSSLSRVRGSLVALACAGTALCGQEAPPRIVALEPANGAVEVDPQQTTQLVVRFDRAMSTKGFSFCGGGPMFPKVERPPRWIDTKTCVLEVALEHGRDYQLSINCPAARNFLSEDGIPVADTPWRFSTLPAELLPASAQRKINEDALRELAEVLARHYSYYEHGGVEWSKLLKQHEAEIAGKRTTRGWASAVASMLGATNDLHLYLRYGDAVYPAGSRRVDPLFRNGLLGKYVGGLEGSPRGTARGRTADGIGYFAISGWTAQLDFDHIERELRALWDTKALILDVRPNSGGDERLAMRIAQHFVDGTKTYAKNVYRTGKGEFGPALERRITGSPKKDRYPGRVIVLTSRYCMSSCEAFLLMMRQAERCRLVGQRSYGSSGNPQPHEIANGVTVFVPSWKALRPDGTCFEGEGIAPDVEIVPTAEELQTRDPILEKALELLRAP